MRRRRLEPRVCFFSNLGQNETFPCFFSDSWYSGIDKYYHNYMSKITTKWQRYYQFSVIKQSEQVRMPKSTFSVFRDQVFVAFSCDLASLMSRCLPVNRSFISELLPITNPWKNIQKVPEFEFTSRPSQLARTACRLHNICSGLCPDPVQLEHCSTDIYDH